MLKNRTNQTANALSDRIWREKVKGHRNQPDTYNWTDRGCSFHPRCLECPEPCCIIEEGVKHYTMTARIGKVVRLVEEGYSHREIARELGCSLRTIQRTLDAV